MSIKTVFSLGLSRGSNNEVTLYIEDDHSRDRVAEVKMSLKELGLLLTGLHGVKGVTTFYPDAKIAEKRVVKSLFCNKTGYDKEAQREEVLDHFSLSQEAAEGWEIFGDGTTSQQNGKLHCYNVINYIPVEDPLDVERYY